MLVCHLHVFFGEMSLTTFGPFLIGLFSYVELFESFFFLGGSSIHYDVLIAFVFSGTICLILELQD